MASHWTSKNAILRDLSVAQGREVPLDLDNTVCYNEKPPALNYTEDNEEEFYSNCIGGGDLNTGPDLDLIQHMLDMVREVNIADIEDQDIKNHTVIEISKPKNVETLNQDNVFKNTEIKCNGKRNRNAAMESLIATYGYSYTNNNNNEESVGTAVKNIEVPGNPTPVYPFHNLTSPMAMFKKKSNKTTQNMENNGISSKDSPASTTAKFVPSSFASETYKKYVEINKTKAQVKVDACSIAEKKIKEYDGVDSHKSSQITSSPSTTSNEDTNVSELKGMDFVRLPQHRHLLTGECKVCQVLCVHREEDVRRNS